MKTQLCMFFFILFLQTQNRTQSASTQEKPDRTPALRVLPGRGFDALTNMDMKQISDARMKFKHKTPDERFVLPSGYVVSLKQDFEIRVDVFAHYSEFFPVTAPTLNAIKWLNIMNNEETHLQIDSSFSKRYNKAKRLYLDYHLSTIRTTARFTLYKIFMYKDHKLDPEMLSRIQAMIDEVLGDNFVAAIQSGDRLVRDYGTRHISSIDVGGLFVREEFLNKSFVRQNRDTIPSHAIQSFLEFVNGDWPNELKGYFGGMTWQSKKVKTYKMNRDSTNTYMFGGIRVLNLKKWMSTVRDNLAIIDRDGEDLHKFVLQTGSFKDYSRDVLVTTSKIIKYSVEKYYRLNSHRGCMKLHSPLIFDASVNHPVRKWCDKYFQPFVLGGFFQNCTVLDKSTKDICMDYNSPNLLTGAANCPSGHEDILIYKKSVNYSCPSTFNNSNPCTALVETHYCSTTEVSTNMSYRFGGVYSSYVTNYLTGGRSCPTFFYPMPILGLYVCTSYQFLDKVSEYSHNIYFGGVLVVCTHEQLVISCPIGYTRHFATFYENCEIYYCAQFGSKAISFGLQLLRPPSYTEGIKRRK